MAKHPTPYFRSQRGTWCVQIGKKQITLGPDRDAAFAEYHRLMAREGKATPAPLTVFDAAEVFLDHSRAVHAEGTYRAYRGQLQPVVDAFGRTRLADLKATMIERWMAGRKVAPDTKRNYVEALRTAARHCRRAGLYDGPDPTEGVKLPRAGRRERTLTAAERAAIWEAATPALRDMLLVVGLTGCRPHVAEALTAASIRWGEAAAVLRSKGRDYRLQLPAPVLARVRELAALRPAGPLLLTATGRPWNRDNRAAAMRRACKKAGLEGVVPYSLRHSFASDALAAGLSPAMVAALLNHSDLGMLSRHYNHTAKRAELLRAAAEDAARASSAPPPAPPPGSPPGTP